MDVKKDILWRVYLSFLGIILLGFIVIGKAFYTQKVEGKYWRSKADTNQIKYVTIEPERGTIYSEDGSILSTSVPVFDVYVDFGAEGLRLNEGKLFFQKLDSLSLQLSSIFNDKTAEVYKEELKNGYYNTVRYYLLKRNISFDQYKNLNSFSLLKMGPNKSGFIFQVKDKRINPYNLMAKRTIGLSRQDPNENVGLEKSYDSILRGIPGKRLVHYTAGAYLPVEGSEIDPIHGRDIVTTIDTYIQDVAENELMKMIVGNKSQHGTAIVMETATGKIKAIANLGLDSSGSITENYNYGIGKATEPGSVFKLVTLLSLLEDNYVDINSIVDCEGGVKSFSGLPIRDAHHGLQKITIKNAFAQSSNVAFAKLAHQYYSDQPSKWIDHLKRFRLDQSTGIDIETSSGKSLIKTPQSKSWSKTTIPFMAHGYEELVTPLHMLTLYNAVANNGRMMRPYLVSAIKNKDELVRKIDPQVLVEKICRDETIAKAKECLREVVISGTAHALNNSEYSISGKTGTAVSAQNNKGYNKSNKVYQTSFIGFFPSENPVYTMAVVIQNSSLSNLKSGASVSGAVFKQISDQIYKRKLKKPESESKINVQPASAHQSYVGSKKDFQTIYNFMNLSFSDSTNTGNWAISEFNNNHPSLNNHINPVTENQTTPNVLGMGIKDATFILENMGFQIVVVGRGRIVQQSITAGTPFIKGQKIVLMLN